MRLRHSQISRLIQSKSFFWAVGIEDTFITDPWPKTGRTLDEYELTGHYDRWHGDIGLMGELGVSAARYGIPWHRIQPAPNEWHWEFVDRAIDRMLELNIEPIVDLVHYGLPLWLKDSYLNPDFPVRMAEYAGKVAQRFKGRVFAYTPLNEPRITAWYCGRLGWWPPHLHGWRGFVKVMFAACRGIVETAHVLRSVDEDILIAHVDATDLYVAEASEFEVEAAHRQELVFLALDLVSGRLRAGHPLHDWLLRHGATDSQLAWFRERAVDLPLIGLNLYPMFTRKVLRRSRMGRLRWTMSYATADIIDRLGELYWARYGRPVFISETASGGSVRRRSRWLRDSVAAVRRLREKGVPMVGYTWWPLFALVTWGYRQGVRPPEFYLKQMGIWNLDHALERVRTPLVDEFRALATGGVEAAGELYPGPHAS